VSLIRVVGDLDPTFAWSGKRLYRDGDIPIGSRAPGRLRGAVSCVDSVGEGWRIIRDPLGINKLFWTREADGSIACAARPHRLIALGYTLDDVRSIPRGSVLDLALSRPKPLERSIPLDGRPRPSRTAKPTLERSAAAIRRELDGYLAALAAVDRSAAAFICLSGGLDSAGIACLASEHFPNLTAVSFDLARSTREPSDDRRSAERLAADLGIPLLRVTVTEEKLLEPLDLVLFEGIDWRDFNVHAALVNAAIADAIAAASGPGTIVLTGDLANEFLADYHPELYQGVEYYKLPRLEPAALRASLVRGLDTCHREVGIFSAWTLRVVQPYAVAVDEYLSLSGKFLSLEDRKQRLSRAIFGKRLPEYVYSRPKVRAQVGDSHGGRGVLAVCAERGLTGLTLKKRFAALHGVSSLAAVDRFIRAGIYRTATPSLEGLG
jgi:asparagine synthetase B (glutamine-hydrolysing)